VIFFFLLLLKMEDVKEQFKKVLRERLLMLEERLKNTEDRDEIQNILNEIEAVKYNLSL